MRFLLTPVQAGDITAAPSLINGQKGAAALADKAYDGNALRAMIAQKGAETVIPSSRSRKLVIRHDVTAYWLGSSLIEFHSQNKTIAASAMAERKTLRHLS